MSDDIRLTREELSIGHRTGWPAVFRQEDVERIIADRLADMTRQRDDLSNRLADALSWEREYETLRTRVEALTDELASGRVPDSVTALTPLGLVPMVETLLSPTKEGE